MSLSRRGWAGVRKFRAVRCDKFLSIGRKKACGWVRYALRVLFCVEKGLAAWGTARLDERQQRAQVFCKAAAAGSRGVIGSGEAAPRVPRPFWAPQRERH